MLRRGKGHRASASEIVLGAARLQRYMRDLL